MVLQPNDPIYNAGIKYVYGLNINWSDIKKIQVNPGACRDSTNTNDIVLSEAVLVDASKQGAGGLDIGALETSKFYQVFVIDDSTKYNPPSALVSLSYNPVLPTGYDMYRRVGVVATETTAPPNVEFLKWYQSGISETKKYVFASAVLLNAAPLNSASYAFLDLNIGVGSAADIPAVPFTATEALFVTVWLAGSNVYYLPYDVAFLGSGAGGPSVHFVPTVASTDTFSLSVGPRVAVIGQLPNASILYRGGLTSMSAVGFTDQLT